MGLMKKSDIGLIGLATMGANFARNIASRGFQVSVYNRTTQTMHDFINAHGEEGLVGQAELKDFVESLQTPRKIILLVKAGKPVDATIESLLPYLEKGDTIIDCGNSHYPDTIRREQELKEKRFHFFGCGISGGEEGALQGPSLMPGGDAKVWEGIRPMFEAAAAKDFSGAPCVSYMGPNGAGHFVKMVHNGIEYGVMQMMAEAYQMLSEGYKLEASVISHVFEKYNQGRLESFLFEISIPILRKKDEDGGFLLDKILDKAGSKGTGMWTALAAIEASEPLTVVTEAVFARNMSFTKEDREMYAQKYNTTVYHFNEPLDDFILRLENALYAGMLLSYAQGMSMISKTGEVMKWDLNLAEITRIWQGGCIIRARILKTLHEAFSVHNSVHLLAIPEIQQSLQKCLPDLRFVVSQAALHGVPLPCLGSALSYFETMTKKRGSANFIQALRDSFGAHTFERVDKSGVFHSEW